MSLSRTLAGLLIGVLVTTLPGCGADDPAPAKASEAATPSPTAVAPVRVPGATIVTGTGYSFALPRGWVDQTRKTRRAQPTVDVAVGDSTRSARSGAVADSMTVTVTPTGKPGSKTLADVADRILARVRPMAPGYRILSDTDVAGLPAAHLAGLYLHESQRFWFEQFVMLGSDQATVISFALDPATPERDRNTLIDSVLRSWAISS